MSWMVEHEYAYGWDDAGWTEGQTGVPSRFATKEQAEAEIDELIFDVDQAVECGDMSDRYDRAQYRAVEVNE